MGLHQQAHCHCNLRGPSTNQQAPNKLHQNEDLLWNLLARESPTPIPHLGILQAWQQHKEQEQYERWFLEPPHKCRQYICPRGGFKESINASISPRTKSLLTRTAHGWFRTWSKHSTTTLGGFQFLVVELFGWVNGCLFWMNFAPFGSVWSANPTHSKTSITQLPAAWPRLSGRSSWRRQRMIGQRWDHMPSPNMKRWCQRLLLLLPNEHVHLRQNTNLFPGLWIWWHSNFGRAQKLVGVSDNSLQGEGSWIPCWFWCQRHLFYTLHPRQGCRLTNHEDGEQHSILIPISG